MKINFSTRIFTLFIFTCAFASAIVAQEKPQALKFDEFEEPYESSFTAYQDELSITERAKRFGRQFIKMRGAKAYIIYYQGRITDYYYGNQLKNKISRIALEIRAENDYTNENVIEIDGGYREKTTVEFWIVPKNSEPPKPMPTLDKSETFVCPKLGVYGESLFNEPDTLRFAFSTYDLKDAPEYTLTWKVSGGEIVGERGLSEIKVKLNDAAKWATAFVEVGGLPYPCPKVFSSTAKVNGNLHLIDDFGRQPGGQIKGRLDIFLTVLRDNPTAKGYIINYGSRIDGARNLAMRKRLITTHFTFRNIDTSRMTFVDGGYREEEASELWISFDENQKPVPTPTIDKKFVEPLKSIRKPPTRK